MFGRIFIASIFSGFATYRNRLVNLINETEEFKAVSLTSRESPRNSKAETDPLEWIDASIQKSSHFVIIAGPREGSTLERLSKYGGRAESELKNRPDWAKKTITTIESIWIKECLVKRASALKLDAAATQLYIRKNIRLIVVGERSERFVEDILGEFEVFGSGLWAMAPSIEDVMFPPDNVSIAADSLLTEDAQEVKSQETSKQRRARLELEDWLENSVAQFLKALAKDKATRVDAFHKWHPMQPETHLQVLGWSGLEDFDYSSFLRSKELCDDQLAFLSINRSLISLPSSTSYIPYIRAEPLDLDFVVADVEMVPHYRRSRSIVALPKKINPDFYVDDLVWNWIDDCVVDSSTGRPFAAPLMFGFNEIIVRTAGSLEIAGEFSYANLAIEKLSECSSLKHIFIWAGWWVPAFYTLTYAELLACRTSYEVEAASLNAPDAIYAGIDEFIDWLNSATSTDVDKRRFVAGLVDGVIKKSGSKALKSKIIFCHSLRQLHQKIKGSRSCMVIGGSSALLPDLDGLELTVLRPKEGLLVWINCASLMQKDKRPPHADDLLKYWLDDMQHELTSKWTSLPEGQANPPRSDDKPPSFRGLPVSKAGLIELASKAGSHGLALKEAMASLALIREGALAASMRTVPHRQFQFYEAEWTRLVHALDPQSQLDL